MSIDITNYPLFENILFFETESNHYDLHNDYDFEKMTLSNEKFEIYFKKKDVSIVLTFLNVEIKCVDIIQLQKYSELIIDNLYRGRFSANGQLSEQDELGRSYYYLEFTQDIKLEFFSSTSKIDVISASM